MRGASFPVACLLATIPTAAAPHVEDWGYVTESHGYVFRPPPVNCNDDCSYSGDGLCDDGGDGSQTSKCGHGSDCSDCGARTVVPEYVNQSRLDDAMLVVSPEAGVLDVPGTLTATDVRCAGSRPLPPPESLPSDRRTHVAPAPPPLRDPRDAPIESRARRSSSTARATRQGRA